MGALSSTALPASRRSAGSPDAWLLEPRGGAAASRLTDEPQGLLRLAPATVGDHPAIHQLLQAVFQGPSSEDFQASLEDPLYSPQDRLLVKRGSRVLAHVHVARRTMRFGRWELPVALVARLGTLPEFRCRGFAARLMAHAEQVMHERGQSLGWLTTRAPHYFYRRGWAVCGRQCRARAGSHELLAALGERGRPAGDRALKIRPWRHVELPALVRLWEANTAGGYGTLARSESYWRWLVSRRPVEQIYVAIEGPDRLDLDDSSIVGYAMVDGDQVLELMAAPQHPTAALQLLARVASDALERDLTSLEYQGPPSDRLFEVCRAAGAAWNRGEAHQGEVHMVRLLDPTGFLAQLLPELHARADAAGLEPGSELGLSVDGEKLRVIVGKRSVRVARKKLGRSYLQLNRAELARLLLGHLDVSEALEAGRLRASTRLAVQWAEALFPRLPFWRPAVDGLLL